MEHILKKIGGLYIGSETKIVVFVSLFICLSTICLSIYLPICISMNLKYTDHKLSSFYKEKPRIICIKIQIALKSVFLVISSLKFYLTIILYVVYILQIVE